MYQEGDKANVPSGVVSVFFHQGSAYYHNPFIASLDIQNGSPNSRYENVSREVLMNDFVNSLDVS